jgi:hypothetical protein
MTASVGDRLFAPRFSAAGKTDGEANAVSVWQAPCEASPSRKPEGRGVMDGSYCRL